MIQDELKYRILQTLGVPPTVEQAQALDVFAAFMTDRNDHVVMILLQEIPVATREQSGVLCFHSR